MRDLRYRFHGRVAPEMGRAPLKASIEADSDGSVATIRLYDPIDSWGGDWGVSAKEFASALDGVKDVGEIRLHINSPGGEVFDGIAIMNALRTHPASVTAYVDGLAASAASFIACAADTLVMGRNTELMIHDPWGLCVGDAEDMRDLAVRLDSLGDNIASVYADKSGGTVKDWRAAMLAESWYSADEAVHAGLADSVQAAAETAESRFDLSVFTYAGRAAAPDPTAAPPPESVGMSDRTRVRHRINERKARSTAA